MEEVANEEVVALVLAIAFAHGVVDAWEDDEFEVLAGTDEGIGNLHGDLKIRFPLPDDQPFDIAVFGQVEVATVNTEKDGIWIRNASYINTTNGQAQAYGARNTYLQGGMAITADFGKLDEGDGVPLVFHVNGGYRYSTDDDYMSYPFMSAAAEFYFMDFLSIFAEYYWDIQLDDFTYLDREGNRMKNSFDMKELTGAFVFHLPVGLDIHLGGSYFIGDKKQMTKVYAMENNKRILEYTARVNPEYKVYGGLTWSGFLLAQDRDGDGGVCRLRRIWHTVHGRTAVYETGGGEDPAGVSGSHETRSQEADRRVSHGPAAGALHGGACRHPGEGRNGRLEDI